jgi:hypothetical protein
MSSLVTACKQQADLENHAVISTAEWKSLISRAYGELYTIVANAGLRYFEYTSDAVSNGTNVLAEVDDHFETVVLAYKYQDSPAAYRDLRELMAQEQSIHSGQSGQSARGFCLVDDQILLFPTPPSGQTYQMRYVPQPPNLGEYADADVIDVVTPDGLEFLIWSVAIKAMAKTEADARLAVSEREAARARFTEAVQLRALNTPRRRVLDIEFDPDERYGW